MYAQETNENYGYQISENLNTDYQVLKFPCHQKINKTKKLNQAYKKEKSNCK